MSARVTVLTRPGRQPCEKCGGDIGAACSSCGGCGSLPPDYTCHCGLDLVRFGWHTETTFNPYELQDTTRRFPRFCCTEGHLVAINFTAVSEGAPA